MPFSHAALGAAPGLAVAARRAQCRGRTHFSELLPVLTSHTNIALHWNGSAWSTLAVPKLASPAGPAGVVAASLAVAGPRSLWWCYQVDGTRTGTQRLLHWNGTAWHAIALPAPIGHIEALTRTGTAGSGSPPTPRTSSTWPSTGTTTTAAAGPGSGCPHPGATSTL
jgi:hypothetical protein